MKTMRVGTTISEYNYKDWGKEEEIQFSVLSYISTLLWAESFVWLWRNDPVGIMMMMVLMMEWEDRVNVCKSFEST